MGELGLNKIFGSILAAVLVIMGLQSVSSAVFSSGGHHGHHGEEKPYHEAIKDKYAYWTNVSAGAATEVEEGPVYDLGLLLASADTGKGARIFGSVCASCHTIDEGGANGTGPNLYSLVGRDIAAVDGFGYSSALSSIEGGWTYEQLDAWIVDPQGFARGSSMVANVKKDPDRANLIAYLAENTPNAPAFPDPLPEESEVPAEGEEAPAEGEAEPVAEDAATEEAAPAEAVVESVPADAPEAPETDAVIEGVDLPLDEIADPVTVVEEVIEDAGEALPTDIVDEVVETVEDAAEDLEMPAEPELPEEEPAEAVER